MTRESGGLARTVLENVALECGEQLSPAMESTRNETIKQTVMAGFGIGCISGHIIGLELQTGKLVTLSVEGFPVMKQWHVIQSRHRNLPPVAAAFRAWLKRDGARVIEQVLGKEVARVGKLPRGKGEAAATARRRPLRVRVSRA